MPNKVFLKYLGTDHRMVGGVRVAPGGEYPFDTADGVSLVQAKHLPWRELVEFVDVQLSGKPELAAKRKAAETLHSLASARPALKRAHLALLEEAGVPNDPALGLILRRTWEPVRGYSPRIPEAIVSRWAAEGKTPAWLKKPKKAKGGE